MSAPDDERGRFAKKYRDLSAQELLGFFEKRESLSSDAVDALRSELRLRGLDPDSLRATVPKAIPTDDEGSAGDATLVDEEVPPDEPSRSVRERVPDPDADGDPEEEGGPPETASPAEDVAAAAAVRCTHCGARNPALEDACLRCGQPLGEPPQHQTMARRIQEGPGARPSGTVASATTGVVGISALVFASYSLTLERRVMPLSLLAAAIGAGALVAAVLLYRAEKKRKDAEAAVN